MDKRVLQTYAVWAKDNLEQQIEVSLKTLGINGNNDFRQAKRSGEYTIIDGDSNSYPADLYGKRQDIISQVRLKGYRNIIEEFAYTWFNRLVALRFMELHDFLPHGFRVLSSTSGSIEPDILKNLSLVKDDLRLDMNNCAELKGQNKTEELFRYVLICQCNALSDILPMLFSRDLGYMELLLPKALLIGETVLTKLIEIPEENFMNDVEIIGWMYQFYISAKKDAVMAAKKTITKDTLPAVTQLFTPDWIVRYMAENSVGRIWMESYPQSSLRSTMNYYVDNPEQAEEVQRKLDEIKYKNVNPEEIRIIEPCSGSGHILVYVMDLLYRMYEEKSYNKRDIPTLILKNNLVGLDVDKRAAQLASFALVMKARSLNNRFFRQEYYTLPHVYELQDSHEMEALEYRKHMKELDEFSDADIRAVTKLVDTFENGKTIGSLIKVPALDYATIENVIDKLEHKVVPTTFNTYFVSDGAVQLKILLAQAKILSAKYDVMITNPPYIGITSMEAAVKDYAVKNYPNSKTDMFAMFMETGFVKLNGFTAMINMHSWMFLSSYEKLRNNLLSSKVIVTMAHLGARAFETIGGEVVQTTTFVLRSHYSHGYSGAYTRLTGLPTQNAKESAFLKGENRYVFNQDQFSDLPSSPIAYWITQAVVRAYSNDVLDKYADVRHGLSTGKNEIFVRLWSEVEWPKIKTLSKSRDEAMASHAKYFPYNKGGEYRKWYGNADYVVWYDAAGQAKMKSLSGHRHDGREKYFCESITWSFVSSNNFGVRYTPPGFVFDVAGSSMFAEHDTLKYLTGLLCSKLGQFFMGIQNPTMNFQVGNLRSVPVVFGSKASVNAMVDNCISIEKLDWDSFETSWDFQYHPLLLLPREKADAECTQFAEGRMEKLGNLAWHYARWEKECQDRLNTLKEDEEELNRIFIDIYGLEKELKPDVEKKDVTIRLADRERDVKSLISYLVGLVMGRYSLDVPGLAYAGGDWDASKYRTYQPDDDGIVPIYRGIGMEDGLTAQLIGLLKLIYGESSYRQNIDFIAESIGRSNNESSEEALNRYLNDGFFADHLKTYQKRPIYWLFSSGKNSGFKCLIYMHRYTSDTLARINSRYFLPESTRLKNDLEELVGRLAKAEGRDRVRMEKERQKLAASYNEAIEYGQVLDHMANQYIEIDLDDGVKTNYAKFQSVEMVTDSGKKVKKDLLASIK